MALLYEEETEKIIKAFYNVYNKLGYGFLEKVYENSMVIELEEMGFMVTTQHKIDVFYKESKVGNYYADIMVNNNIILELKAVESIKYEHECQLINYLKATKVEVGLLFNFGKSPKYKRKIYSNRKK